MTGVQFGWSMPVGNGNIERNAYLKANRRGLEIIAHSFDSAWMSDHVQFGASDTLEGWTALTYLAAQRPELKFGHLVLCQLFRNPALLAKMAATLQYMSQGRFIFGIGAGWHEEECNAYNIDFPTPGERVESLEETLQITRALWTQDNVSFQGKYHSAANAYCHPRPDPLPPILIAGFKPRMLNLIARYADWWEVGEGDIDTVKRHIANCEQACREIGRNPASLRKVMRAKCICAPNESIVHELATGKIQNSSHAFVGTPKQIIAQIRPFIDLGIDYFILSCEGFPNLITLQTLVNDVLPQLSH
ncbi:LLM class flavin-dependent oxidoreductase [Dictyobacter arantiisoli]|uniref:LLM class F420-dependent oxidoreductase n=1 Tax=Dictyobacter arantiisoli TaxID=2014874 RepID=A0A5A5TJY1_9CHLR|nr:LLM class flavin-dependent oxidoreductase [Dictyobacter arantiisoli]GCF11386.1 LLM class F420-dependent oxidoreductase [Dictyobacter arantiisoli]